MTTTRCAACEGEKEDDWVICEYCLLFTVKRLREIPKLHTLLGQTDWLKVPVKIETERPTRSTSGGTPANLHVLSLLDKRTDIRSVLTPWVEDLIDRCDLRSETPTDVLGLCNKLLTLADWWACHHPAAGDLTLEIKHGHDSLIQVVNGSVRKTKPPRCPKVSEGDTRCTGRLRLSPDKSATCHTCGAIWSYDVWSKLANVIAE